MMSPEGTVEVAFAGLRQVNCNCEQDCSSRQEDQRPDSKWELRVIALRQKSFTLFGNSMMKAKVLSSHPALVEDPCILS
jgi:hypothetical protein